jgi:hypothetical protein
MIEQSLELKIEIEIDSIGMYQVQDEFFEKQAHASSMKQY